MLSYYKTQDGRMMQIPECEPGCWINCVAPDDREINSLISDFNIEPDFFRAAMDEEESSHIDHEDQNTLIVIDIPVVEKEGKSITYTTMPLGIIITERNVITVSIKDNPVVGEFAQGLVRGVQTNLKTRFVLHIMLRVASRYLQYLKQIDKISNYVETELRRSMRNAELLQLLSIEKSLVYFSSSLKGNEITLEKIMRGRVLKLYEDDQDLLEDVLIEVKQAIDMSNIYLNIVNGIMGASSSVISNNLNTVMRHLVSVLLLAALPMTIFGLYGMNVKGIPLPQFWFPLALAVVLTGGLFAFLKKKKMLD
ncbi:magnesium transporter CorA family protein [Thermocaproicibacter melissae]|uniref:magnesium transporter CorA family protein n=1 Tax=Thermocaproicibacter melissae TaxID=2966552 RepID=UPI0024B0F678|nr:magnesium transporter CorA family protein [Thermocaproicibacter melissae]WBY64580.1 magnesium transporter CorA family protein [Thermocaproicibacter melissae]